MSILTFFPTIPLVIFGITITESVVILISILSICFGLLYIKFYAECKKINNYIVLYKTEEEKTKNFKIFKELQIMREIYLNHDGFKPGKIKIIICSLLNLISFILVLKISYILACITLILSIYIFCSVNNFDKCCIIIENYFKN